MENYTINEVAMMTGLMTRTLRNYIRMGILKGEKLDGIWKFTAEDMSEFLENQNVRSSIQAKNKSLVFDFLTDDRKKENKICTILDLYVDEAESDEITEFFCTWINESQGIIELKLERNGRNTRIYLSGAEDTVMEVLNTYYERE